MKPATKHITLKTKFITLCLIILVLAGASTSIAQSSQSDTIIGTKSIGYLKWEYYTYNPKTNEKIKELPYKSIDLFSEGLAQVTCDNDKYGFIDEKGNEVIPCIYDFYSSGFSDGLACVNLNNVYLFIDKTGKDFFSKKFDHASRFSEKLAYVEYRQSGYRYCGFIDKTGNIVLSLDYMYEYVHPFSEGLSLIKSKESYENNYGFIDKTGKEIIPPKYDFASDFRNGFAFVVLDDKKGYIDTKGNEVIPVIYEHAGTFLDKMFKVKLGDKWGLFDADAKEIFSPKYNEIEDFCSNGLVKIKSGTKYGCLDCNNGKEIVPPKYDEIEAFYSGIAIVKMDGKLGYIDSTGAEIVVPKYDDINEFRFGLAKVKTGSKYGYIDRAGNEIIPAIYDEADDFIIDHARVVLKDKSIFIDKTGKKVKL